MKQILHWKLRLNYIIAFVLFLGFQVSSGQGLETFENHTISGTTYVNGSFVGDNGVTWNYNHVTGEQDFEIESKGILLRRSDAPSYIKSDAIPGGIQDFSIQMRKAFTGAGDRQIELFINGESKGKSITFGGATGADATIHVFEVKDINVSGDIIIEIRHITGNTANRQMVIDNLSWTGYTGGTPTVSTPLITPGTSHVWQPLEAEITSATAGATIYYSLVGEDGPWTEYTEKINVTETTTIWAYAEKEDMDDSAVRTVSYTFPTEVANIAALRAGVQDGRLYKLTGEAIVTLKVANRNQIYIQDASGAILIDDVNPKKLTSDYSVGDGIVGLIGSVGHFNQMIQIVPVTDAGAAASTGNVVEPLVATLSELGVDIEAQLVKVKAVTITTEGNFTAGSNFTINDGTAGVLRTAYNDLDYINTPVPSSPQDITGFVLRFNSVFQLVPRSLADIVPSSTVSVGDVTLADVVVYTDAVLNQLKVVGSKELAQVELVNAVGAVVKSVKVNSNNASVAMSELPKGVYIVRITSVDGSVTVSKVINR